MVRTGIGYDSHRLEAGRPLILGGQRIPFEKGLAGHSDADAVAHALTDAILGAAAAGDIGKLSRIVTLNNISIVANPQSKDGTLVMDAITKTFRYLDADELAAKKKAAEAAAKGARK